jgi:hypothetical protein
MDRGKAPDGHRRPFKPFALLGRKNKSTGENQISNTKNPPLKVKGFFVLSIAILLCLSTFSGCKRPANSREQKESFVKIFEKWGIDIPSEYEVLNYLDRKGGGFRPDGLHFRYLKVRLKNGELAHYSSKAAFKSDVILMRNIGLYTATPPIEWLNASETAQITRIKFEDLKVDRYMTLQLVSDKGGEFLFIEDIDR